MILNDEEIAAAVAEYLAPEADDMHRIMRYTEAIEAAVIRKLVVVSVEPVASDNPDFMTIPVEYQYAYPDGTWRCSNGDAIAMNALQNASNACEAAIAALEGMVNRV